MKGAKRIVLFPLCLWVAGHFFDLKAPFHARSPGPEKEFRLLIDDCHDGDTCRARNESGHDMRLRFAGIDAPEVSRYGQRSSGQAFGAQARDYLRSRLRGRWVRAKILGGDSYRRYLALIFPSESPESINEEMVANGYAFAYRGKQERADLKQRMLRLEKTARDSKLGMWGLAIPPEDPSAFRHRR